MPVKFSPNRRRSIAVLNQGGGSSKAAHRRRAYSIAPGEKLSPAARARNLIPRKSILKGSLSIPNGNQSGNTTEVMDGTQSMDITETQSATSRKSLNRRVSFASHAHVRLFEVQDPNASSSSIDASPVPPKKKEEDRVEDSEDDNEENAQPAEPQTRRRSSQARRRSSTAFTEYGEQSMDMDEGDSAMDPQQFLGGGMDEEDYDGEEPEDEDDYGDDMDMTEAMPREFLRKRSLSLGGPSGFVPRRRSSVATSSLTQSENQVPQQQNRPPQELLYPTLQLEDILNLPPEDQDVGTHAPNTQLPHDQPIPGSADDVTSSTMALTDGGEEATMTMTTSSGGDDTQPMEFTIPVVRPPAPPSKEWLQLRAMTHSGAEPYVPEPHEPSDDPEANAIVDADTHRRRISGEEQVQPQQPINRVQQQAEDLSEDQMELTNALNRLQKARSSLGLPALPDGDDTMDFNGNATFETEDSFVNEESFSGDHTINITKLRQSLGGASRRDESMDVTSVYGEANADTPKQQNQAAESPRAAVEKTQPPSAAKPPPPSIFSLTGPARAPVFSLPGRPSLAQSNNGSTSASRPSVFFVHPDSAPEHQATTSTQSAPHPPAPAPAPPMSPVRAAAPTVPHPFTFSLDARLGAPSPKGKARVVEHPVPPKSPSKIPIFRGTAAFAPPVASPTPRKRPAPVEDDGGDRDMPSPAKRQAVGHSIPSKSTTPEEPPSSRPQQRRTSAIRRPSGYYAQRKSLSTAFSLPDVPGASGATANTPSRLRVRASLGGTPSAQGASSLYPDLTRLAHPPPRLQSELYPDAEQLAEEHPPTPSKELLLQGVSQTPSPPPAVSIPPQADEEPMNVEEDHTEAQRPSSSPVSAAPSAPPVAPAVVHAPPPPLPQPHIPAEVHAAPSPPVPVPSHPPATQEIRPSPVPQPQPRTTSPVAAQPLPQPENHADEHTDDEADMDVTEQWRDGVDEADEFYDGEEPTISIEQFFQMTGIRFMDELTAPRRSTIHPGQLRPQNRRRSLTSSHAEEAEPVPLSEFMAAMAVDVPQLELYSVLATELTAWIEESKKICRQAEEDAVKMTPALFREFANADESEKADLVHQLKLIKAHCIGAAKSQWYDWKSQWVGQLQNAAAEAFTNLESDAKVLEDIIKQTQDMLPSLRAEYAQAALELRQEEADVAELQNSDKDYLNELKASIAEQDIELQAFKASVSEADAKLKKLGEKMTEIEAQKQENEAAIAQAEQIIRRQTESTSAEVSRLREELEALQDLHMWRMNKLDPSLVVFVYANRYTVTIPCMKFYPVLSKVDIQRVKGLRLRERDKFPQLTQLMLQGALYAARSAPEGVDLRQLVHRLGDFWTSCAHIKTQLTFLSIKYPLTLQLVPGNKSAPTFRVTATVLFASVKAKAFISFIFDFKTYSSWPTSLRSLQSEVQVAYGNIEQQQVLDAVLSRLSQATPSENHGCLLDACIEATERYAQA